MSPALFSERTRRYVRRRAEATMVDDVRILRVGLPVMEDSDIDLVVEVAENGRVIYDGPARVHRASGAGVQVIGDVPLDVRTVTISIPWNAPVPRQDDVVVVDESSDTDLVQRAFQVREVDGGGLFHERRSLTCTGITDSRFWERR